MIRVANAPCSWGILEFDGDAKPASYATVLDEIRDTGYEGTELGDWGFMPTDPAALRHELASRGLTMVGAFVPVALANPETHAAGAETAVSTARLMRDAGAADALIVLVRRQRVGARARTPRRPDHARARALRAAVGHVRRRRGPGRARCRASAPACAPCFIRIAAAMSRRRLRSTP